MYLENVVVDAVDPGSLGRFWEAVLGTERLTDEPEGYETRLAVPDGPVLDLCFQRVGEAPTGPRRLHLDLRGSESQQALVERVLRLGATRADIGQGEVSWEVLADPEGHLFCVLAGTDPQGPVASLCLESDDPARDRDFWGWLSGWQPVPDSDPLALRHPSGHGPLLELSRSEPKGPGKNRMHLDIRLEAGDDVEAVLGEISARGGREPDLGYGDLPWRHAADPSGNELCLLPAPTG